MVCGSSVVECRTRNREGSSSNPLCYRFEDWPFLFSPLTPQSTQLHINEYLAIDIGGNVSEYSHCAIAAWLECFQEKPSWCRNEQVCQGRKSVKRFERSNGLDIALYKNIPLPLLHILLPRSLWCPSAFFAFHLSFQY